MFENGILAEIEVENLNHLEEKIRRLHVPDRKITVLNVQHCSRRGRYSNANQSYDTDYFYRVFITIGETHQQAKKNKEDREQLRRDKRDQQRKWEAERDYTKTLSEPELAAYKKQKRDEIKKQVEAHEAREKERSSIPYLKKKLEEAKEDANKAASPGFLKKFSSFGKA